MVVSGGDKPGWGTVCGGDGRGDGGRGWSSGVGTDERGFRITYQLSTTKVRILVNLYPIIQVLITPPNDEFAIG